MGQITGINPLGKTVCITPKYHSILYIENKNINKIIEHKINLNYGHIEYSCMKTTFYPERHHLRGKMLD